MHITVDVWLAGEDVVIEPNYSDTGVIVHPVDDLLPKATLYLGVTRAEVEATRDRLNRVIEVVLEGARDARMPEDATPDAPSDLRAAAVTRVVEEWRPRLGTVASIKAFVTDLDAALSGDRPSPGYRDEAWHRMEEDARLGFAALSGDRPSPRTCARYWGSDGTLCSTHGGHFGSVASNHCGRYGDRPSPEADPSTARLRSFAERVANSPNDTAGTRAAARYALTGSLEGVVDEMRASPEADPPNLDYESEWYRKGWAAGFASGVASPATAPAEGLDVDAAILRWFDALPVGYRWADSERDLSRVAFRLSDARDSLARLAPDSAQEAE